MMGTIRMTNGESTNHVEGRMTRIRDLVIPSPFVIRISSFHRLVKGDEHFGFPFGREPGL